MIFHFSIIQDHFVFWQLNFIVLFHFLWNISFCLLLLYLDWVVMSSFPVSSTVFPKGVTGCGWVTLERVDDFSFSIVQVHFIFRVCFFACALSRMHLHSGYYYYVYVVMGVLRLLLLRLCGNGCAEALVAYSSSLLNRLTIVHGGNILTIIVNPLNEGGCMIFLVIEFQNATIIKL